jgi:ABC-type Fe3+/spermidine/putrescine transport system ATPase subunit
MGRDLEQEDYEVRNRGPILYPNSLSMGPSFSFLGEYKLEDFDVRLESVTKRFGDVIAVNDITLNIKKGEFLTLLGGSGCGKTTTLRMVAGFLIPDKGEIFIGNQKVTKTPPFKRNTGMVFQNYALFPHKTVFENVGFGLKLRKFSKREIRERVNKILDLVKLSDFGGRYPNELSGGQKQRVALARAVTIEPDILLLDEPLGALDLKLREELQLEVKRIQRELMITTLYVTHDQTEALSMSDRIAVMKDGKILQLDSPYNLYEHPHSKYVANFVGKTNFIEAKIVSLVDNGKLFKVHRVRESQTEFLVRRRTTDTDIREGDHAYLSFRPEHVLLGFRGAVNRYKGRIEKIRYSGNSTLLFLDIGEESSIIMELQAGDVLKGYSVDEEIEATFSPDRCFLLRK